MIIDIHKTFGYSFDPLEDTDKTIFFKDASLQQRFFDLWATIADRFSEYSEFVAYELLNEIIDPDIKDEWNEIALKAIDVIRKHAKDSWIIFGGVCYNAVVSVPLLAKTDDKKVAYTFHCYEPMVFTHQGAYWVPGMPSDFRTKYPASPDTYVEAAKTLPGNLAGTLLEEPYCNMESIGPEFFETLFKPALDTAAERDIPLYCGEYGVIDRATPEDTVKWYKAINAAFEELGIGRSAWSYRQMDFGLSDARLDGVREELVKYL
jgi:aryl-phospho-beta-D-glucosidase BglC (GH1 family)